MNDCDSLKGVSERKQVELNTVGKIHRRRYIAKRWLIFNILEGVHVAVGICHDARQS